MRARGSAIYYRGENTRRCSAAAAAVVPGNASPNRVEIRPEKREDFPRLFRERFSLVRENVARNTVSTGTADNHERNHARYHPPSGRVPQFSPDDRSFKR